MVFIFSVICVFPLTHFMRSRVEFPTCGIMLVLRSFEFGCILDFWIRETELVPVVRLIVRIKC